MSGSGRGVEISHHGLNFEVFTNHVTLLSNFTNRVHVGKTD